MEEKVIKVSDWSQKYKLIIYAVFGIGAIVFGYLVLQELRTITYWLQIIVSKLGGSVV